MPNGIYPNPRTRVRPAGNSPALRLRVWWQLARLDDELARAADAESDPALDRRARQLGTDAERARLADTLEGVLRDSDRYAPHFSVQLTPRHQAVRDCAGDLRALINRLRDDEPVDVQGVAMVARLLVDGASPLYYARAPRSLRHTVRAARHALDPVFVVEVAPGRQAA